MEGKVSGWKGGGEGRGGGGVYAWVDDVTLEIVDRCRFLVRIGPPIIYDRWWGRRASKAIIITYMSAGIIRPAF